MSDSNTSNPVFAECHVAKFWLRFLCLVLSTSSKLYHSIVCGLNSSFGLLLVDSVSDVTRLVVDHMQVVIMFMYFVFVWCAFPCPPILYPWFVSPDALQADGIHLHSCWFHWYQTCSISFNINWWKVTDDHMCSIILLVFPLIIRVVFLWSWLNWEPGNLRRSRPSCPTPCARWVFTRRRRWRHEGLIVFLGISCQSPVVWCNKKAFHFPWWTSVSRQLIAN